MPFGKIRSTIFFRVSLFSALFLMSALVLLTLVAVQMGKKLDIRAQFFSVIQNSATLTESSQLKTYLPMDTGVRDKGIIDEMLARYYLEMRYEQVPDANEMTYRWGIGGPVYLLSTPKLYNDFAGDLEKKVDKLSSSIITIDITGLHRGGNVFQIDFDVYETPSDGSEPRRTPKTVSLEFRYIPARVRYSSVFSNPYGLTFIRIDESK